METDMDRDSHDRAATAEPPETSVEQERREAALASIADYERTGLHLTGEEVDAWLARIEAGEDAPPPPCHR